MAFLTQAELEKAQAESEGFQFGPAPALNPANLNTQSSIGNPQVAGSSPTPYYPSSETPNLHLSTDDMPSTVANNFVLIDAASGAGGSTTAISTVTANYTPVQTDGTILCNGLLTVTLSTGLKVGTLFRIKNIGVSAVTLSSAANIDQATTLPLNPYTGISVDVQWDGTQWWVL